MKVCINTFSALVFPVNMMNLGAVNNVRMIFCCFCVLGRHVELALGEARTPSTSDALYITLHIAQSHRHPKASSLSSVGWVQASGYSESSSVLADRPV
jgi:hypothetical protein